MHRRAFTPTRQRTGPVQPGFTDDDSSPGWAGSRSPLASFLSRASPAPFAARGDAARSVSFFKESEPALVGGRGFGLAELRPSPHCGRLQANQPKSRSGAGAAVERVEGYLEAGDAFPAMFLKAPWLVTPASGGILVRSMLVPDIFDQPTITPRLGVPGRPLGILRWVEDRATAPFELLEGYRRRK